MGRFFLILLVGFAAVSALLGGIPSKGSSGGSETPAQGRPQAESTFMAVQSPSELTVTTNDGAIELDRSNDGHFYADVQINGSTAHMLVDTGASGIALSRDDARNAGIATSIGMNEVVGRGADGEVRGEYVKVDRMELGPKTVEGLNAIVLNSGQQSLLGQTFLAQFDSVEIHGNTMVLH